VHRVDHCDAVVRARRGDDADAALDRGEEAAAAGVVGVLAEDLDPAGDDEGVDRAVEGDAVVAERAGGAFYEGGERVGHLGGMAGFDEPLRGALAVEEVGQRAGIIRQEVRHGRGACRDLGRWPCGVAYKHTLRPSRKAATDGMSPRFERSRTGPATGTTRNRSPSARIA